LLLDEPTNHLDLKYQVEVLALARHEVRRGLGALIVLHDLNLAARVCDRVLVLQDGRLVAEGEPAAVLSEALIRSVYGAQADVFVQPGTSLPVIMPRL
jgi:iron complex transport system ATP-binding protein